MKLRKSAQFAALSSLASLIFTVTTAQAVDYYWDIVNINDGFPGPGDGAITGGGGFNWGTGNTRWTTDGGANNVKWPNTTSDIAVFTDVGGTVGVNEINLGGITFNNPSATGYTLTSLGTAPHLGDGGVIQTLAGDGSHVNTIPMKLQLMGTTATFSSNSANSTMEIGNNVTDTMTLGTGVSSATLTLNGTNTGLNRFGYASGDKRMINNKAIAIVKDGTGTWWLSGRLEFTGGLTIKEGDLVFSSRDDCLGTTGITLGNSAGGDKNATLVSGSSGRNISRPITLASTTTGTLTIAGGSGLPTTTYSGGVTGPNNLTLDSRGTLLTMFGAAINHAGTLTVKGEGNTAISSGIGSNVTGLTKNDAGTLTLSSANTHPGATSIVGGTLSLTHALALQNSALDTRNSVTGTDAAGLAITPTTLTLGGLTGDKNLADLFTTSSGGYTGLTALTLNPGTDITHSYTADIGNGTGSMALAKTGSGTQVLSAANTYSGNTTVSAGTLTLGNPNPANDASTVTIATDAILDLTYTGTDTVGRLFIGTKQMPAGVYGPSATSLPQITNSTGTGTLTVTTGSVFSVWIAGTGFDNGTIPLNKQGPNDDYDNDGIPNLVEFAIAGQDPTVGNATIGTFNGTTLSFTKRADATGLTCAIVESTDLGLTDGWAEVTGGSYVNNATTISFALSPGTPPRNFIRLQVTQLP